MKLQGCGAAVLLAAGALWVFMSETDREEPVLGGAPPESVRALEASVAAEPNDSEDTRALAQAYLDARQPGLAIVLVDGAPPEVRGDVRVEHVYARALIDAGRNDEALAAESRVVWTCRLFAEGNAGPDGCDAVLLASAMRRTDILRELVSLGVEDARSQPAMSLVAYMNATREARVAME
ncbi:MAG: CDC27 family protein [Myxococcota bacterium]|nr:CDC27 family protein [Myxococcota bacterium]